MILVELTEDKYGQAMKDIACIQNKLENIKEIFESEATGYSRNSRRYSDEDHYDERERYSHSDKYGRYV